MTNQRPTLARPLAVAVLALALAGCSLRQAAVRSVGGALATGGTSWSSDDDPELVRDAAPFALKTIESLLAEVPDDPQLLLAATSSFTQYSYAFVANQADYVEAEDLQEAIALRARAVGLYRRALGYGLRGLEARHPGFEQTLRADPAAALAPLRGDDVPLLYWTGAAWAAAFAIDVADSSLSVNQTAIEKMMRRALALDEGWEKGSLHDFFISWEAGHASAGGTIDKAKEHFARAKALAGGQRVSPLVSYAESVLVAEQKKKEFEQALNEALAIDIEKTAPEQRLANVLAQRRAKWLLSKIDELF